MKKICALCIAVVFALPAFAANKYWVTGPGPSNWSNTNNWSNTSGGAGGAALPTASDIVIFDAAGTTNPCNIDVVVNVAGFNINGYTNSITHNGNTITIGSSSFSQNSGTFNGGTANITINRGIFVLSGGTFTSTTSTLSIGGIIASNVTIFTHAGGTFAHNNGKVVFNPTTNSCASYTYTVDVLPTTTFYDAEVNAPTSACGYSYTIATAAGDIIKATHDFTHTDGIIAGQFSLENNLTIGASADGGTGTITFNGTGTQTYYQVAGSTRTCAIIINKTSGSVTPAVGDVDFYTQGFNQVAGDFTAPPGTFKIGGILQASQTIFNHQAGTFTHNNGKVMFDPAGNICASYTYTVDVLPTTTFYDAEVNAPTSGCGYSYTIATATGDTAKALHNFTHTDGIIAGQFSLENNLTIGASADGGTGTITFNGTGTQTYYQATGSTRTCVIVVNKTSGAVTPAVGSTDFYTQGFNQVAGDFTAPPGTFKIGGILQASQTIFNHQAGTFMHNSGKVIFDPAANLCASYTYIIDVLPATTFYDVEVNAPTSGCGFSYTIATAAGDTAKALHNFTHTDGIIAGQFSLENNLTIGASADGGTGTITFNGTGAQTYYQVAGSTRTCIIAVNKTSGVVTPAAGSTDFYTQGFNQVAGDFTAPPGTFKIGGVLQASQTIFNHQAGTFTHNNGKVMLDPTGNICAAYTYTVDVLLATLFYDMEINAGSACGYNYTIATATGDTLKMLHDITHTDGVMQGQFSLKNNLTINANADGGTGTITFNGTGTQTYYQVAGSTRTCVIAINKTSGSVTPAVGDVDFYTQGFNQVAGDFTAPPGTFKIGGILQASQTIFNHQAGTFMHNSGKVMLDPTGNICAAYTYTVDVLPATLFYDMEINAGSACGYNYTIATATGDTLKMLHDITHTDGVMQGQFSLKNNLTINANADGGTGTITFNGTGTQTYYQVAGSTRTCVIAINKISGSVTPAVGDVDFYTQGFNQVAGDFTAPPGTFKIGGVLQASQTIFNHQAGTFTHNNGKVMFDPTGNICAAYTYTVDVLPATLFYDMEINAAVACGYNYTIATATGDTLKMLHDITHTDGIMQGQFSLQNNLTINAGADGGKGTITFNGTGAQTYYQAAGTPRTCVIAINKISGSVTPAVGDVDFYTQGFNQVAGDFTAPPGTFKIGGVLQASQTIFNHQAGTFTHNNGKVMFDPTGNICAAYTYTVDVLPATLFYDMEINAAVACGYNYTIATATGDTLKMLHDITHTDGIMQGQFSLQNNLTINAGADGGKGTITFNGTGAQTYYQAAGTPRTCVIVVNKASGAVTPAAGSTDFYTQGFNQVAGDFTAPPGTFKIGGVLQASQTIFNHQAGTFTHNNGKVMFDPTGNICAAYTYTVDVLPATLFYDMEINAAVACGYNYTIAAPAGDTINVANNINYVDGISNAPVKVSGNVRVLSTFDGGTGKLVFNGTANQNFDLTGAEALFDAPIEINKPSSVVTLLSACQLDAPSQSIKFTKGNLITTATNLLIVGVNVTALNASAASFVQGPVKKIGNNAFTFPLGKTYYAPIYIAAPTLSTDAYTCEYFLNDPNSLYNTSSKDATLDHICRYQYWDLQRNAGTSNVKATLYWNYPKDNDITNLTDLRIAKWNGTTWKNEGNGGTTGTTTTGSIITAANLSVFGPITFASATLENPVKRAATVWNGNTNTDWNTAGNWDNGVPTSVSLAIIPCGCILSTLPILNNATAIAALKIENTATVTINSGYTLSVSENFSNKGTITGAGGIVLNGTQLQTISGGGSTQNLELNNTAGAVVANTAGNMLNITGKLIPTTGTLTTNNLLTLKSTASGTAQIAQGSSAGNYINGKVIYERYIPARRSWRIISFPFTTSAAPTINASLQEGVGGNNNSNPNPGYGTHISGGSIANGFDQNVNGSPSIKELSGISWIGLTTTNQPITNQNGYFLFVRGSRANNLAQGVNAPVDNTTLRGTGNIKQGNQSISVGSTGWQLMGNPFPSPVNLDVMAAANSSVINKNFKFWDPRLGGSNNVGGYITASYNGSTYDYVPTPVSSISEFTQSGAGFFVDAKTSGSISINESHKATGGSDYVFRPMNALIQSKLTVNLHSVSADNTTPVVDGAMVAYSTNFSDSIDEYDATKLKSGISENLSVVKGSQYYSIERRGINAIHDTIYLNLGYMYARNYQLEINPSGWDGNLSSAVLEDIQVNTSTPLDLQNTTMYTFSIASGYNPNRFRIVLKRESALPVKVIKFSATPNNGAADLSWETNSETDVSYYQVEKSNDGVSFFTIGKRTALNTTTALYDFKDTRPGASSYYRIKIINKNGAYAYTNVVHVNVKPKNNIFIYPNPIENNTVQFVITNMKKGDYTVNIYNDAAQLASVVKFKYDGVELIKKIKLPKQFVAGVYNITISGAGENITSLKFIVQ